MTYNYPKFVPWQRGVAAVEMALLLPIFLVLLMLPLYFGRVFWHYSVVQSAAQDAARYLSSVPQIEMKDPNKIAAVVSVANTIITAEIAELNPGNYAPVVTVQCGSATCSGFALPSTVTVNIQLLMEDIFFSNATALSIPMTAVATFPYVGH
jgi:Flp pilus assembly protein TadG